MSRQDVLVTADWAEKNLGTQGIVFLEVDEDNEPARRLYQRAGFREVGRRPGYYQQGRDRAATALVLRRDLT